VEAVRELAELLHGDGELLACVREHDACGRRVGIELRQHGS
jgi:hypothetical protein